MLEVAKIFLLKSTLEKFQTFDIADPSVGTGTAIGTAALTTNGDVIGDCATDSFSIASPGNVGSPGNQFSMSILFQMENIGCIGTICY